MSMKPSNITNLSNISFSEVGDAFRISLCLLDAERKIVYMNRSFGYDFGVNPEEAIGQDDTFFSKEQLMLDDVFLFKRSFCRSVRRMEGRAFVTAIPLLDEKGEVKYVGITMESENALDEIRRSFDALVSNTSDSIHIQSPEEQLRPMLGRHPKMEELRNFIKLIGPSDASVLIMGESGTGKEVAADCIQALSSRKDAPYVKINCAAIPPSLLESELFGYEAGAFTGANRQGKVGLMEIANNGTLFLDEIGDMPTEMQPKLLRALQHGEIFRVGGSTVHKTNVRVIAATNSNLDQKIAEGKFREDLYYRLAVIPIHLPSLRERRSDIIVLTNHFLSIFSEKYKKDVFLKDDIRELLFAYDWPGNIRELQNIIEYYVVCSPDEHGISPEQLQRAFRGTKPVGFTGSLEERMAAFEKSILKAELERYPSLRQTAKALDIDSSTLSRKAKRYGITLDKE